MANVLIVGTSDNKNHRCFPETYCFIPDIIIVISCILNIQETLRLSARFYDDSAENPVVILAG